MLQQTSIYPTAQPTHYTTLTDRPYHSAQIKWDMLKIEFSLSFRMMKNYDTIRRAWEFAINWEQPKVCSLIRLEIMLFQSEDGKKWALKRVWK